jgi:hypothetical protein
MNTFSSEYTDKSQTSDVVAQREGPVARKIERQTAKLPSDLFLWAAGGAILLSLGAQIVGTIRGNRFMGARLGGLEVSQPLAGFIGSWVPSLLLLGVYNKIVKVAGSDRLTR